MSVQTELALTGYYEYGPDILIRAEKRVPVTLSQYVPIAVDRCKFGLCLPKFELSADGTVSMTINGLPFGFFEDVARPGDYRYTQKTKNLVLSPGNENDSWTCVVDTPEPLSPQDTRLFNTSVSFYYYAAVSKALDKGRRNQ